MFFFKLLGSIGGGIFPFKLKEMFSNVPITTKKRCLMVIISFCWEFPGLKMKVLTPTNSQPPYIR